MLPVSLLSSYLYCSRKVFLQKVLEFREPPKPQLLVGSIRHSVFERFTERERDVIIRITRSMIREDVTKLMLDTYDEILRDEISKRRDGLYEFTLDPNDVYENSRSTFEEDARFRAGIIADFMERVPVEHEALYEQLTPRIVSERRFENTELGIVGIIDRMLVYGDEAVPFEFKTGRTPRVGLWPGHRMQLAAYLLLARSELKVNRGIVRYLDTGRDVELRYTPFVKHEVQALIKEVRSVLEGNELPRKVEQIGKCRSCGLRDACYSEPTVTKAMVERFGKDAVIR